MMPDLPRIYDRAFFTEWGSRNDRYVEGARVIATELSRHLRPKRIVDVGCGCGVYSHWLRLLGVETVAIDGVEAPADLSFEIGVHRRDLTVPFENEWGRFDFALCLEVAEHIPEIYTPVFLDNLARLSDLLVLSAAPEGQGGHHHVNERPKRYWVKRLADVGYLYDRPATGRLMEALKQNRPPFMWMAEHISLYRRAPALSPRRKPLPFGIEP